jgi:hypothetical protein
MNVLSKSLGKVFKIGKSSLIRCAGATCQVSLELELKIGILERGFCNDRVNRNNKKIYKVKYIYIYKFQYSKIPSEKK